MVKINVFDVRGVNTIIFTYGVSGLDLTLSKGNKWEGY